MLIGDDWLLDHPGPWTHTGAIPGATGSTVYDRDGYVWVRNTAEWPTWTSPERGIAPDSYLTYRFGPFTTERKDMATKIATDRTAAKQALEEAQARLAEFVADIDNLKAAIAEATPDEPQADRAVIRFKKYGGRYDYAAIRTADGNPFQESKWYVTQDGTRSSRQGIAPKTWAELLEWIGERNWDRIEVLS